VPKRKPGVYDARREGLNEGLDDGRIKRFLAHVWKKEKLSAKEGHCIMNLCMAATYDPEAGIRHRYEEFDDDHSDIDYRMDVGLPFLYRALTRK
jgi:hypothetical protein